MSPMVVPPDFSSNRADGVVRVFGCAARDVRRRAARTESLHVSVRPKDVERNAGEIGTFIWRPAHRGSGSHEAIWDDVGG